ncbi:NTF2 and RRM domain protein [Aspergillus mulundensis]|uniref:NTF2 domain-containing protein n=1 Tax=Aspergillus mulundensis TaxID=1810919 RepID=A0A3D8T3Q9_9EURO|nr:hypothetical protein DSM5745_00514 [Aspergillus mulundensis]RDW93192.1 hypothetical protein DSM5745_00514 [Aspergillus mulundensis]
MADTQIPINGTYQTQPAYTDSYNHAHTAVNSVSNFQPAQSSTPSNAPSNDQKNGISKDEVGWYFVEQYYTNMSRSPDKLHLFYSRRSQLVFGTEAESVPVAVGQKAIQEKIKQLDFQDCKVRVLNVDAQASFENILISVIGEISNKQEPSRKFVQTFVLAEQPNGYYVLNDVFRYLVDEEEVAEDAAPSSDAAEEPELQAPVQTAAEPSTETEESKVDSEEAVAKVDEKLETAEEAEQEAPAAELAPQTNGTEQPEPAPETAEEPAPVAEAEPEKPVSPEPTPAPAVEKETPATEAAPPAKAAPKTWASIASKVGAAAPVVPAIPAARVKPAPAAVTAPQPAATAPAAAPSAAPAAESVPSQPSSTDGSGWQTAGHDHKKSQARTGDNLTVLGYIKNVTEKVNADLLKETLERFGKLTHFDNCAFIEFADRAGYNAAVAANPHQIGTEQVKVEERRPRGNVYGGNANYGPGRGGTGRGRGDRAGSQGRGGFQREGRGGFAPRGRGGNANAKPRNQGQTA